MKLKNLLKVIPEHHFLGIYDFETDEPLFKGYKDNISADLNDIRVEEVQGITTYLNEDENGKVDPFDGVDMLMIWVLK